MSKSMRSYPTDAEGGGHREIEDLEPCPAGPMKLLPQALYNCKLGHEEPVVEVVIHPPGGHLESPIVNDMSCVAARLLSGRVRYFGTDRAFIGSDLRIHMRVNPFDEVLNKWEDAE